MRGCMLIFIPLLLKDHVSTIRQWFDGEESGRNKELRAHGGTPLASSIHNDSGNSAYQYIKNAVQYWCQDNWLVVLTDGADNDFSSNPTKAPNAVKALYDASLGISDARPVKTMVIGMVDPRVDPEGFAKEDLELNSKEWLISVMTETQ